MTNAAGNRIDRSSPSRESAWEDRFGGVARLVGGDGVVRLRRARVFVAGIGGVGTWVAEALARSGVGSVVLVDGDDVCVTNTNRQLHAVAGETGRPKVAAMGDRLRAINPGIEVVEVGEFLGPANLETLLERLAPDAVVDAIDEVPTKCRLIAACRARALATVVSGGAGGRSDPTLVRVDDLARSGGDPLLRQVRRRLRREHGFPDTRGVPLGVRAVFSPEAPRYPWSDGSVCTEPEPGSSLRLDCASGFGTAAFVTGSFGLAAAGEVVRLVCGLAGEGGQASSSAGARR